VRTYTEPDGCDSYHPADSEARPPAQLQFDRGRVRARTLYFSNSELWLATCFHEPSRLTKVSVDRIVRTLCSP
jgi:hypothetical protein